MGIVNKAQQIELHSGSLKCVNQVADEVAL